MTAGSSAGRTQALRLLDETQVPGPLPAADDARALAWALKDLCYRSWSSEPQRAVHAADALRRCFDEGVPAESAAEIEALVRWTEGIALVTQGRVEDAVASLDAASGRFRDAGLADAAAQAQVPKVMALSMLGRHAEAAACGEAARAELLALGNVGAASRVGQNLGALHFLRDDYPAAALRYREAAVLFARLGDHLHSVLADIGLADALTAMGDFDEALRIYARARMRAGQRGFALQLAQLDESVALLQLARGRYPAALAGLESARRRYEALAVPQYLAIAEKELGDAYLALRLLPEARALLDAAVARFAALSMPDEQAWALAQRGRAEALLAEPAADASFAESADLFDRQGNAVGGAAVALARAELALANGDAIAAAAAAGQAAAAFAGASQAAGVARAEVIRAEAWLATGRAEEAHAAFTATLLRARAAQQLQLQVQCLTGQGLAAQALGSATEASAAFEAAIALFEEQRRVLPDDAIRSAFLVDHLRPYEQQLGAAVAAGEATGVLWQLERFRARALDLRLGEQRGRRPDGGDPDAPLRERLDWLYRRARELQDEGAGSAVVDAELARLERDLLERARRRRLGAFDDDRGGGDAAEAADALASPAVFESAEALAGALAAALQAGDALVEYGVLGDELFACVVTRQGVALRRRLAGWNVVREAIRSARFQIESLGHGALAMRQQHLGVLTERSRLRMARLHALVWAPLADLLEGCGRVLVVPHGELAGLPFAALDDGNELIGERHEIALAPSARIALRGLLRVPPPPRNAVAVGESSRLAHAAAEAELVVARYASGQAFVGDQATAATLRSHAAGADVLHLACHALFRRDSPRFSALHLLDMAFNVGDAEALELGPCTVVLSACETAGADVGAGDEAVGMVRAFLAAGAARVIASQWPVDDAVTAQTMAIFHGALAGGDSAATALRLAQGAVRLQHPHPYFWACFTLYGGW